jgi:hypothetical protein
MRAQCINGRGSGVVMAVKQRERRGDALRALSFGLEPAGLGMQSSEGGVWRLCVGSALLGRRENEGGDRPSWACPWWGREAGRAGQIGERREREEKFFSFSQTNFPIPFQNNLNSFWILIKPLNQNKSNA